MTINDVMSTQLNENDQKAIIQTQADIMEIPISSVRFKKTLLPPKKEAIKNFLEFKFLRSFNELKEENTMKSLKIKTKKTNRKSENERSISFRSLQDESNSVISVTTVYIDKDEDTTEIYEEKMNLLNDAFQDGRMRIYLNQNAIRHDSTNLLSAIPSSINYSPIVVVEKKKKKKKLSSGSIAAIVICVIIGVLILSYIIFTFFLKKSAKIHAEEEDRVDLEAKNNNAINPEELLTKDANEIIHNENNENNEIKNDLEKNETEINNNKEHKEIGNENLKEENEENFQKISV